MKLLLIEDDLVIAKIVTESLQRNKIQVMHFTNGIEGKQALFNHPQDFSCIILDIILPDIDGLEVCKQIREKKFQTPILILSSKSNISDKVIGLNQGADDYLIKPFAPEELLARVTALTRRDQVTTELIAKLTIRNIRIDGEAHEVFVDDCLIDLSHLEYKLLYYLMTNSGRLIDRAEIKDNVWEMQGQHFYSNSLTVHIKELRKKIHDTKENPLIITVRGAGYKFAKE